MSTLPSRPLSVTANPSPLPDAQREQILANPGFGRSFTDHMVRADYADGQWGPLTVVPYAPLTLDPATMALHYGQLIFEGLKAYQQPDGSVATFRPDMNAARFNRSAQRLAMAQLPEQMFLDSLSALVEVDRAWVPTGADTSLYFRPFMVATEVGLGVNKGSTRYAYLLIASPAGAYFPNGVKPVTVWLSTDFTRAAPGGTGEAKCAGNYAAAFLAQAEATEQGCDQVVWLDAAEHRYVEEMGGMNLFFVHGSGDSARVVTPRLTGTLLPGVTRDSLLTMAADLGYGTGEATISTDDWRDGCASGEITEVFACGTAAVITPVGHVKSAAGNWTVGGGDFGPVAQKLRGALVGLHVGTEPDPHGWMHTLVKGVTPHAFA